MGLEARLVWRALRLVLLWLSWLVVAALVVVTAFHLAHREPWNIVVGLIAATPWVYLPAWLTAAIGLGVAPALACCRVDRAGPIAAVVGGAGLRPHLSPGEAEPGRDIAAHLRRQRQPVQP